MPVVLIGTTKNFMRSLAEISFRFGEHAIEPNLVTTSISYERLHTETLPLPFIYSIKKQ